MNTLRANEVLMFPNIIEISEEIKHYQDILKSLHEVNDNVYNHPEELVKIIKELKIAFSYVLDNLRNGNLILNSSDYIFLNSLIQSIYNKKVNIAGLEFLNNTDIMKYSGSKQIELDTFDIEYLVTLLMENLPITKIVSIFKGLCIVRINTLSREGKVSIFNLIRNVNNTTVQVANLSSI